MLVTSHSSEDLSSVQPTLSAIGSLDTENSRNNPPENAYLTKAHRLKCMRHLQRAIDSDDDIDSRFEKAKLVSESPMSSTVFLI